MKYQWQCLAFGVSTTESLGGAWSIATVNLSPFGKQQINFQIFKIGLSGKVKEVSNPVGFGMVLPVTLTCESLVPVRLIRSP